MTNGLQARLALTLMVATAVGVWTARQAEEFLNEFALSSLSFQGEESQAPSWKSRYSIVLRAGNKPAAKVADDSLGALHVNAGPLSFDVALYDECVLRDPRDSSTFVAQSQTVHPTDSSITVTFDPVVQDPDQEVQEWLEPPDEFETDNPIWVRIESDSDPMSPG